MRRPPSIVSAAMVAALFVIVALAQSQADKRRPTISTPQQCTKDATAGQATVWCEGLICSCCYSDGCYICNKDGGDCVWDPGRSGAPGRVIPKTKVLPKLQPDGAEKPEIILRDQPKLEGVQP